MPRYFFDLYEETVTIDEEGTECRDLDAARFLALRTLGNIVADLTPLGIDPTELATHVRDEEGDVVFIVALRLTTHQPHSTRN